MAARSKKTAETLPTVVTPGGVPTTYEEVMAQKAAAAKARAQALPGGGDYATLSFRGGAMRLGEQAMGSEGEFLILAFAPERAYYDRPFNENDKSPPACYSLDGEKPHESIKKPCAAACEDCPMNEWGSSGVSNAKACKEGARFAVVKGDVADFASAQIYTARASTLNSKHVRDYVDALDAKGTSLPQVVTRLTCVPDGRTQYRLGFKALRPFRPAKGGETDYLALIDKAERELARPYPEPKDDGQTTARRPQAPQRGGVRRTRM